MGRKYLDDIGVVDRPDTWCSDAKPERLDKWKNQRETYGFDERDTWDLREAFIQLLYERLMMYKEVASEAIDLGFHKFKFRGKVYTQEQLIDLILSDLKYWLTTECTNWEKKGALEKFDKELAYRRNRALDAWKTIFQAMWW